MSAPLTTTVSADTSNFDGKDKGTYEHEEKLEVLEEEGIDPEASPLQPLCSGPVAKYTNANIVIDEATNIRIRRLINRRILPIMLITYITQTLDKGTLAFSSIMGLQQANHLVGQEYSLLGTGLYLGYLVGEFPMNYIIQRAPLGKFLGSLILLWGIMVFMHAVCSDFKGLMIVRVLLGVFESGVQPCLVALTVMYYRREEHPQVISYWFGMQGAQLMISGLLSFGIYHITSYPAWKALFLLVGSITIVWGCLVLWLLPDSPMKATIWPEEDKVLMVERLRSNELGVQNKEWKWNQMKEAFKDIAVWILVLMQVSAFIIVGGLAVFANIIVKGLGFTVLQAQLLNLAQGAVSLIVYLSCAYAAKRTNQTLIVGIIWLIPAVAGTVVLAAIKVTASNAAGMLIAFYVVQFVISTGNLLWSLFSRNIAGATKKVTVMTMAFLAYATGCIIGPQVFQSKAAPRYISAWIAHLVLYGVYIALSIALRLVYMRRNLLKRRAAEAAAGVITGEGAGEEHIEHKHAFSDLTDVENPDFRYSY